MSMYVLFVVVLNMKIKKLVKTANNKLIVKNVVWKYHSMRYKAVSNIHEFL